MNWKNFIPLFVFGVFGLSLMVGCSGDDSVTPDTPSERTIVINQTPDTIDAPWTLTKPGVVVTSGIGDHTIEDMSPGEYTLTWGDVGGYVTPNGETQSLDAESNLVFMGNYFEPNTIVINQTPDNQPGAGWSLIGPQNETGTGDAALTEMPLGDYTLTWDDVIGNDNLSNATQTLETNSTATFWGVYYSDDAFVTTWNTSHNSHTSISLGLAGDADVTIHWGDGKTSSRTGEGPFSHTYDVDGIYTVLVFGSAAEYHSVQDRRALVSVDRWGRLDFTDLSDAFEDANSLVSVPDNTDGLETVTNMSGMFCSADTFNQNIGGWDTSNVTDMSFLFSGAALFNQDIGDWNTSNVTNMSYLFSGAASFNGDIGDWDTSKVTNMLNMFVDADLFNQNIGGWDTSNVIDMRHMFYEADLFNQDLSGWCVELITSLPRQFDSYASSWVLSRPIWGTCP